MAFARARSHLLIALILGAVTGCNRGSTPRIGEVFDAGPILVEDQQKLHHVFAVRNTTGRRVKITKVQPTCSCTTSKLSKMELAAGEVARLELGTSLSPTYGRASVYCALLTDHPDFPEWGYTLSFETLPRMVITPGQTDLGVVKTDPSTKKGGQGGTSGVELWVDRFDRTRPLDEALPTVEAPPELHARLGAGGKVERIGNGLWHRRYPLTLSFECPTDAANGAHGSTVTVKDGERSRAVSIVTWHVRSGMQVSPPQIHALSSQGARVELVNAEAMDPAPLQVIEVQLAETEFESEGSIAGLIECHTTHPHFPTVTIHWNAWSRGSVRSHESHLSHGDPRSERGRP